MIRSYVETWDERMEVSESAVEGYMYISIRIGLGNFNRIKLL